MSATDAAFFYQYGVGLVFFLLSLVLAHRTGALEPKGGEIVALVVGIVLFYGAIQGGLQFLTQ